jgi:uncharacterized protein YndB with AHSA1/START domain
LSIEINAPVDEVFDYMSNPRNQLECDPNAISVTDVKGQGLGMSWTGVIKGPDKKNYKGECLVVDYIPNQKISVTCAGEYGIAAQHLTYLFESTKGGGTRVSGIGELSGALPIMTNGMAKAMAGAALEHNDEVAACYKQKIEQ